MDTSDTSPIPKPNLQRHNTIHLKKNVSNYSLSELFGIKSYTLDEDISVEKLCEALDIDMYTLARFNNLDSPKPDLVLKSDQKVLLPKACNKEYLQNLPVSQISVEDVRDFHLEECKQKLYPQSFYVCYMTSRGDVIGSLTFYENFLHFRPVSAAYSGKYDFQSYSLTKNDKMEFTVDYRDIVDEPRKVQLPDEDGEVTSWLMQLPLSNNGYACYHDENTKHQMAKFIKNNEEVCSVAIKVRTNNLTGKSLTNDEQEDMADKLIELTKLRICELKSAPEKSEPGCTVETRPSETCVPYFDIQWGLIFGKSPKVDFVNSNLSRLHDFFGYRLEISHVSLIQNTSMSPLDYTFYELCEKKNPNKEKGHYFYNPEVVLELTEVMHESSDILSERDAHEINK